MMEFNQNNESFVLPFNKVSEKDINKIGNKALNLIKLIKNDFLVPNGFIVTSNTFELLIREANLANRLNEYIQQIPYLNVQDIEKVSQNIRSLIENASFPVNIISNIKDSYLHLKTKSVAIRSSATLEDLPTASFAGLYESYLNINSIEQVITSIRKCFSSFWTPQAIIYRINNNIPHDDFNLAVIVQEMVDPKVSGVLFTTNPITSNKEQMLLESNYGLGESVVSGEITPDQYYIERKKSKAKSQLKIINRRIGTKTQSLVPNSNELQGGVMKIESTDQQKESSSLNDNQIIELAKLGLKIEARWKNQPQDVEWVIDDQNKIFILQTRPITGIKKFIPGDNILWSRGYADDYWNDNTTPLFFDLLGDHLTKIVNIELNSIMGYKQMDEQLLRLHKAHVYFNLNVLKNKVEYEIPKFLRNKDLLHYFPEGFGSHGKDTMRNLPFRLFKRLLAELRVMFHDPDGSMSKTAEKYEQWTREVFIPYCNVFDIKLQNFSDNPNLKKLYALGKELDDVMITHFRLVRYGIPVHNLGMNLMTQYLLRRFLGEEEAMQMYPILISGLNHKLTETNDAIYDLVNYVHSSSELNKLILNNESDHVLNSLKTELTPEFKEFELKLNEFLKDYGDRGYTREPYYPRWNESPSLIIDIIKSLIFDNKSYPNDEKSPLIDQRIQMQKLVEAKIKSKSFGILIWKLFSGILKNSRKYICFRENQRFNLDKWITRHRRLFLMIGSIFTSQGLIDRPDHIFFFYKSEIRKVIEEKFNENELKMLSVEILRRYEDFKLNEDTIPPKFILNSREFDDISLHDSNSTILFGSPASQGSITASVRILKDIEEIPNIKHGEIIVVPRTDPGWTPAFSKIGGLITETGGVLSHGAVISREYGIPAVTNVQNASKILKSGQTIYLNGFNGQIKIKNKDKP